MYERHIAMTESAPKHQQIGDSAKQNNDDKRKYITFKNHSK